MNRILPKGITAAFLVSLLLTACSFLPKPDQVSFGIWAAEQDLWDEAIFRWKRAVALDPNSVAAHNNLAVAYEKKGLWEEARREYEIALKLAPENRWLKANYQSFKENLEASDKAKEKEKKEAEKDEKK
ncbi:MAG: tetratricopeptide repeat protein [Clostridiales bacterium]|jgi:tetratricopeptide (TPR) repeat protein|nr:tetratricopeptide repeat protein [Clostridiales bacterium]